MKIGRHFITAGRYEGSPWRSSIYGVEVTPLVSGKHIYITFGRWFGVYVAWHSPRAPQTGGTP